MKLIGFRTALSGIWKSILSERNMRIHLLSTCFVVFLGFFFKINTTEWLFVLLSIGLVISFEMINTAIEKIMDFIHPKQDPKIAFIKDVSAGAVLVAALIAALVGIMIFFPRILMLIYY
jgi:undecaprenol kinase